MEKEVGQMKHELEQVRREIGETKYEMEQMKREVGEIKHALGQTKETGQLVLDDYCLEPTGQIDAHYETD